MSRRWRHLMVVGCAFAACVVLATGMTAVVQSIAPMQSDALPDSAFWAIMAVIPVGFLAVWHLPVFFCVQAGVLIAWGYGMWALARWLRCNLGGVVFLELLSYPAAVFGSNFLIFGLMCLFE